MPEQKELFGFEDMRPKLSLKKVITKERLKEIQTYLDNKDGKSAAEKLRELNEELEKIERRITNKPKDDR